MKSFHVVIQCRVKPSGYEKAKASYSCWRVKEEADVRPVGVIFLETRHVHCRHGKKFLDCCGKRRSRSRGGKNSRRKRSRSRSKKKKSRSRSKKKKKSRSRSRSRDKRKSISVGNY